MKWTFVYGAAAVVVLAIATTSTAAWRVRASNNVQANRTPFKDIHYIWDEDAPLPYAANQWRTLNFCMRHRPSHWSEDRLELHMSSRWRSDVRVKVVHFQPLYPDNFVKAQQVPVVRQRFHWYDEPEANQVALFARDGSEKGDFPLCWRASFVVPTREHTAHYRFKIKLRRNRMYARNLGQTRAVRVLGAMDSQQHDVEVAQKVRTSFVDGACECGKKTGKACAKACHATGQFFKRIDKKLTGSKGGPRGPPPPTGGMPQFMTVIPEYQAVPVAPAYVPIAPMYAPMAHEYVPSTPEYVPTGPSGLTVSSTSSPLGISSTSSLTSSSSLKGSSSMSVHPHDIQLPPAPGEGNVRYADHTFFQRDFPRSARPPPPHKSDTAHMSDGGSTQSEAFARQEAARIQAERDRVIRLRYEQLKVQERNRRTFERDHVTRAEFKERKKEEALHRRYQRLLSTKNSSDPDAETKPATPDAKDN